MGDSDGYRDDYFALLIGNGTFDDSPDRLKNLAGPLNDVEKLSEALTDARVGLFRPENVEICTDFDGLSIMRILHQLVKKMSRKSHFLLYYSGHGLDHNGKLALATRTSTSEAYTGLPMSAVLTELGGLRAEQRTLILDCCYAGLAAEKSAGSAVDTLVERTWGAGNIFLRASDDETAKDALPDHVVSPFTEALIEGLFEAPATGEFVDLGSVYDDYMVDRLRELGVPEGNLQREGQSIPIARREPVAGTAAGAPALTTHFEMLDRLEDGDAVEELDLSGVSLEEADEHLAALVKLGERLVPAPQQRDGGQIGLDPDGAMVGAAREFLHRRLRAPLVRIEPASNTLRRFRLTLADQASSRAGLPWEHLPLDDGRPIAWCRGLVVERSVDRRFPLSRVSGASEKIARLGFSPREGASTFGPQEIAWEVAKEAVGELAKLGVDSERKARPWRGVNSGNTDELPPYLLLYPVPRRLPPPYGRGLEVNVDGDWVAADIFVERLTAARKAGGTSPRLVLVETIADGPTRDATRATAELAHRLACAGLGHVAFVCHPRGFKGYPPDPEDADDARTFAAYLINGVDRGLDVHRAFHVAVQRMAMLFDNPAIEFGVPGLYVTEYERAEPESVRAGTRPGGDRPRPLPDEDSPHSHRSGGGDFPSGGGTGLDHLPAAPPPGQPPPVRDEADEPEPPASEDDEGGEAVLANHPGGRHLQSGRGTGLDQPRPARPPREPLPLLDDADAGRSHKARTKDDDAAGPHNEGQWL